MDWQQTSYFLPLVIAAAIAAALAAFVSWRRSVIGSTAFMLLMLAVSEWSAGYALELASANLPAQVFWARIQYVGIVAVPVLWLLFALAYTAQSRWLTRRNVIVLCIIPAITLLLVWSNDVHHLVWREVAVRSSGTFRILDLSYGAWFWINLAYAYLMLALGTVAIARHFLRSPVLYRRQSAAMLLAASIPWLANALYVLGLSPFPNLDLTPFAFTLTGMVAAWALFRLRLLDIMPVAHGLVVDSIDDGVIVLDHRGRIVDLNPAARQIVDLPSGDLVGQFVDAVLSDWPDLVARYRDLSRVREEIVIDGKTAPRHIDLRILPLHSRRGQLAGRLVVLGDITAQKRVETALTRQMQRQTTLSRFLVELGQHLDPQAIARMAVTAVTELTGWPAVAVLLPDQEASHLAVQASAGAFPLAVGQQVVLNGGAAGRAFSLAQTHRVRDHKPSVDQGGWCCELAVPFVRGGRVLGVLDVKSDQPDVLDTDDILLAESLAEAVALALDNARLFQRTVEERQRLLTLIASSKEGIILVGVGGVVWVINAAALAFLQLEGEPEDWTDRSVQDVLLVLRRHAPDLVRAALAEARRILDGDDRPGEGDFSLLPRIVHWSDLPVVADTGPLGWLLVLRDVTEERQLERMRDDLTHTMVHDLRNPLTGISVSLELLDHKAGHVISPAQRRVLRLGQASAQKMLTLVNAILDTSRLESGRMPLDAAPVVMHDLVSTVLEGQTVLAEEKNLRLENAASPALSPALADPTLIERVLVNLIGNGVKFTPNGGLIKIEAKVVTPPEAKRSEMHISVFNSGSYVPPEARERLFEQYTTGSEKESGSGLGLAFCKLAVEAHRGRIWVESEPEWGTTFLFSLPLVPEPTSLNR